MYFHAAFERIANWKFKGSLDIHTFFTKWERDMFFHQIVKLSLYFPQNPDWRTTQLNVLELAMNYALKFPIVRLVSPALPDHYLLSNVWCGKRERIFDSSWNGISSSIVLMPCYSIKKGYYLIIKWMRMVYKGTEYAVGFLLVAKSCKCTATTIYYTI